MKHNLMVMDGFKDEAKVDEVIEKAQELKDFWIKMVENSPPQEKKETDLL